jgi:hypothetical protein
MRLTKLIQESFSDVKLPFAEHQMKFLNKVRSSLLCVVARVFLNTPGDVWVGASAAVLTVHVWGWGAQLAMACQTRARDAQDLSGEREIMLSQMQTLVPMIDNLHSETPPFPIDVPGLIRDLQSLIAARKNSTVGGDKGEVDTMRSPTSVVSGATEDDEDGGDGEDDDDEMGRAGAGPDSAPTGGSAGAIGPAPTLRPKKHFPSHTGITIRVERICLKDPEQYIEPFLTVRLCDEMGKAVRGGEAQDTAPGKSQPDAVAFNQDVHLQIPYEEISKWGFAVFIEFMYYKPKSKKKDKMKCLCWSMLEPDELHQNKTLPLEIYAKKPVYNIRHTQNYSKLKLQGANEQYLYVTVIRHEPEKS